jgi:type IV secretory pathway protease TraF
MTCQSRGHMKAERFALLLTSATLLGIGTLRWCGLTGNLTESEPQGLYLTIPGLPERGSMVALRPLMKHAAGLPGDTVTVTPQGSFINGKLWPDSAPAAHSLYRPYPFGIYHLGPYQYWLLGTSPASWDSRYEGPFPADLLANRIAPLLTARRTH